MPHNYLISCDFLIKKILWSFLPRNSLQWFLKDLILHRDKFDLCQLLLAILNRNFYLVFLGNPLQWSLDLILCELEIRYKGQRLDFTRNELYLHQLCWGWLNDNLFRVVGVLTLFIFHYKGLRDLSLNEHESISINLTELDRQQLF